MDLQQYLIADPDTLWITLESYSANSDNDSVIGKRLNKMIAQKKSGDDSEAMRTYQSIKEDCAKAKEEAKKIKDAKVRNRIIMGIMAAITAGAAIIAIRSNLKLKDTEVKLRLSQDEAKRANRDLEAKTNQLHFERTQHSIDRLNDDTRARAQKARDLRQHMQDRIDVMRSDGQNMELRSQLQDAQKKLKDYENFHREMRSYVWNKTRDEGIDHYATRDQFTHLSKFYNLSGY